MEEKLLKKGDNKFIFGYDEERGYYFSYIHESGKVYYKNGLSVHLLLEEEIRARANGYT